MLEIDKIEQTELVKEPFPHFALSGVLKNESLTQIGHDFPVVPGPGIYTLSDVECRGAFERLIGEIRGAELEGVIERKFGVDLSDKPLMITVRGFCQKKDGRIHTDSKDKLITCLLYLNEPSWNEDGGRLRFLRDGKDINSTIAEVPPLGGNFVAFQRTDNSWHGHEPFEGRRRYIMFNWLRSDVALAKNLGRHKLSAAFKRIGLSDGY